ncbi:MAG: glycoside hydrolase family 26 protein [Solirubrobacterales bacterium]
MGKLVSVSGSRRAIVSAFAVLLALLVTPLTAQAAIKLGAYYCPTVPVGASCFATSGETLDSFKSRYGRFPSIALSYRGLDATLLFSSEKNELKERGVAPMVTVEPYVGGQPVSIQDIAGGKYDSYIRSQAASAASYGQEVLLRFAHEMNGAWYPWGGEPIAYVAAWRHYVDVFHAYGASNVKFVWSPNVNASGNIPFDAYYPEDFSHPGYVDYVALDGYNWGGTVGWRTLRQIFRASYIHLNALSGGKPVILAETASVEEANKRPRWIRTSFLETIPKEMPNVVAVVWFDRNLAAEGNRDWTLESTAGSISAWQDVVNSPLYGGNVYYLRPNGPRTTPKPWTIVNAETAWESLSENALESVKAGVLRGYISATTSTEPFTTEVELDTTPLTGKKVTAASAWFYTPVKTGITFEARSGSTQLAGESFTGVGWHSLDVSLNGTQSQLDNTFLRFASSSGTSKIYAAFLRLTLDPK